MMYHEFVNLGAKGEISQEVYDNIEDVYCAYDRFDEKADIVKFWNQHGKAGIDAMMEPLNRYREMKSEAKSIHEEIAELQKKIALWQERLSEVNKDMHSLQLQCGLGNHWTTSV